MSSPTVLFPRVEVSIQPHESDIVHFLRCAPSMAGDDETGLLNLRLRITNRDSKAIKIEKITIKVVGSTTGTQPFEVSLPSSGDLAIGASVSWNQESDHVFAIPHAPSLKLEIFADGFSLPAKISRDLVAHENPTPHGSYRFWGRTSDLKPGEYWQVHGTSHGQTREQMFAYDVGVAKGTDGGGFDLLRRNVNGVPNWGSQNNHYRIWGKPIYAVAAGEVRHFLNDFPDNLQPSSELAPNIQTLINNAGHGNGNFFTIATGDETVLYAHLQRGSLNKDLLAHGAEVNTGDFLGLAGNSGASSNPHLHIHANQTNTGAQSWADLARPMVFRHAAAVAWSALGDFDETPWSRVDRLGMPTTDCAIWPAYPPPRRPDFRTPVAIDPLAMVLAGNIYVDLSLPNPPPDEVVRDRIRTLVRGMGPGEKRKALARLKSLDAYHKELQRELER